MLDLTMRITADGSQAKGELRSVEQSIQRVESASDRTTPAIGKIGTALTTHGRSLEEWDAKIAAIEANSLRMSGATETATASLSGLSSVAGGLGPELAGAGSIAEGATLSAAGMVALSGGAVAAAAALGTMMAVVVKGSREYFEHADSMKEARSELDRLGDTWHQVEMMIGAATVGGDSAPFVSGFRLLEGVLFSLGLQLAADIELARQFVGVIVPLSSALDTLDTLMGGVDKSLPKAPPRPTTGYANPAYESQSMLMHGAAMGAVQGGMSASLAESLFGQSQRGARRGVGTAAPAIRPYATVPSIPGDRLGMYGFNLASLGYGSAIDLGAAGFGYAQVPNLGYAPPGGSGLSMLWGLGTPSDPGTQLIRPPSLTSQLFGNLGTDVAGQIFRMVGRGSNSIGGQLGGAAAGSVFSTLGSNIAQGATGVTKFLGGMLGPLGAIGGSLLGSLFGSLFGETQGHKDLMEGNRQIADMKQQLLQTYGSMENLQRLGKEFGIDWKATWGDQNLAGAAHFKSLMDQMAAKTDELNQKIADTKAQIHALGGDGEVTWQTLSEAVQRYGGDISKLGGTFQTARMHDEWQQIIDDMDLFTRGGISAGDALGLMSSKVDALVIQSMQFGTTIPENMRPYIQTLIDQGKLLDASGEKITDISKLSFGETLQTTLEKLNATLETLVKTLSGDIPAAAESGADRVQKAFDGIRLPQYGVTDPGNPEPMDAATAHRGAYVGMYGALPAFHRGGEVPGWLLPGEFVMQKSAVQQYGLSTMRAMNSGALGRSSAGGSKNYLPVKIELSGRPVWEGLLEVAHAEGMV